MGGRLWADFSALRVKAAVAHFSFVGNVTLTPGQLGSEKDFFLFQSSLFCCERNLHGSRGLQNWKSQFQLSQGEIQVSLGAKFNILGKAVIGSAGAKGSL